MTEQKLRLKEQRAEMAGLMEAVREAERNRIIELLESGKTCLGYNEDASTNACDCLTATAEYLRAEG